MQTGKEVPNLGDGGIVPATTRAAASVRVGEGGRDEAVVPLGSGQRSGIGTTVINNYYNIQTIDPAAAADAVYDTLQELEATGRTEMKVTAG